MKKKYLKTCTVFGSNGSLAKRMRRSAAEKRREDNDGD